MAFQHRAGARSKCRLLCPIEMSGVKPLSQWRRQVVPAASRFLSPTRRPPGSHFPLLAHVPQLDRLVLAPRGQRLAVRAERHAHQIASVCPLRVACSLPVATSHSLIVLSSLPEASVLPSGLNATEFTQLRVSLEGGLLLARRHVPQLDRVVLAPRGQRLAVRAERHGRTSPSCAP